MAISSSLQHFVHAIIEMFQGILAAISGVSGSITSIIIEMINFGLDIVHSIIEFMLGRGVHLSINCASSH